MRFVVLDFETFFSDEYTLKRLSTEAYIRDPRFVAHGAAIKWSKDHAAKWYDEPELRFILAQEDWSDTMLIHHHAQFDSFILSHHYGVRPKRIGCTLAMARLLLGNHLGVSLDAVRQHFGMPLKTTPYNLFRGKHWHELTPAEQTLVADGACDEVESIWKLFGMLSKQFPAEEYDVVDTTVRMFVNPQLLADIPLLAKIWSDENDKKSNRLAALGVTESDLQSADKFADLLRAQGVEPDTKPSPADPNNRRVYAFAKTDDFMRNLLEDDNETVRMLAEARLGVKSTFTQTRAETLGWMARRGPLPVYLSYAGTGTLRPSGGDKANWLNFKRGSDIRRAVLAPEGYLLAPIDSSQIECRMLHYLAGGPDDEVLQKFRDGHDPYADLASAFYGEIIYKPGKDDPRRADLEAKRGAGKQARLMCGYGAAGPKYKATAKAGLYGPPIDLTLEEANRQVSIYRDMTPSVCLKNTGYWAQCSRMLARLAGGDALQWGPLLVKDHRIWLPNGCPLIYDTLEYHRPSPDEDVKEFERDGYWRVKARKGRSQYWKTMWGSKLTQNICEAVARVIVTQAMNRITRVGYRVLNHPYDELLCLIPKDGNENAHLERCKAEMKREVPWLPGLPLDCEAVMGPRYEK
jgi:DNA polymerase